MLIKVFFNVSRGKKKMVKNAKFLFEFKKKVGMLIYAKTQNNITGQYPNLTG